MESLSKNLIKNVEVNIGDNKTIAEMVDGNLKVEHYYKNEIIIENNKAIGVEMYDGKKFFSNFIFFLWCSSTIE